MTDLTKELKVLIVEDESKLAILLKEAISSYCYSITLAVDGKEGIEKFLKVKPDIVITDIMMPNLDGLDMTLELKKISPNIPIIILSAFSDKEKLLKAIDVGISKYFIKPFDPDEVLNYINKLAQEINKQRVIKLKDNFTFDNNTKNLYQNKILIRITKREKHFLELLIKNQNAILNIKDIKSNLWDNNAISDERVRTFVKRFRIKTSKTIINNISGQGYTLPIDDSQ